jgi:crotonobetainyl-CoA:carnitine CoA-transferase CaiB-like acyl-CoA transferase
MMEARFLEKPRAEWLEIMKAADVPAGPVGKREEWLASELIANNDMRATLQHPKFGEIEMPGVAIKLDKTPGSVRHLPQRATADEVAAFAATTDQGPAPADAPREGPLAGYRVLDMGTVIAGAYCNAILANLGADVVKVESAEGDPWRDRGIGFTAYNRGKRGLVVDLKQPEGRQTFLDLAAKSDVVLDNYRNGVRARLGVDHADVLAANPRIISGSITTYGSRGEEIKKPGFDPLLQARSGQQAAQGGDNSEPVFHQIAINDFASAASAAFGVITALNGRERTGEGQTLETSLTSSSALFQAGDLTTWAGAPPAAKGCRDCLGVSAMDRFYRCEADLWLIIAARHEADAEAVAKALGHPEWATKYDMMAEKRDGSLAREIETALAGRDRDEAVEALFAAGVRTAPLRKGEEILTDPWLLENEFFDKVVETPYGPVGGRPYAHFSRSVSGYSRPEPGLGEHSFEVVADFGIDEDRVAKLGEDGVIMVLC